MGGKVTGPLPASRTVRVERVMEPKQTFSLDTTVADTPEIDYRQYIRGHIHIPTGSSITSLTFHSAPERGGTYTALHDTANAAVTVTVAAGRSYPLPDAAAAAAFLKIVVNAAGDADVILKG